MMKPKLTSLNLGKTVDEAALADYTNARGVPKLSPVAYTNDEKQPAATAPPLSNRAPTEGLKAVVPDYLAQELRVEAAKRKVTISYLVIDALKDKGFRVEDADICGDFRRPVLQSQ